MFGESVLTTANRVASLYNFGESVLTSAKRVGDLCNFGEAVLTSKKCAEDRKVRFDVLKACRVCILHSIRARLRRKQLTFEPSIERHT